MFRKTVHITVNNLAELEKLATNIATSLTRNDTVTFSGNLGVGKTTFIRYIIRALAEKEISVTSPTFNLVAIYQIGRKKIWHFDLYRLIKEEDIFELGIEEALIEGISFIEWPELISRILPKNRLEIEIQDNFVGLQARIISLNAFGVWQEKLGKFLESEKT